MKRAAQLTPLSIFLFAVSSLMSAQVATGAPRFSSTSGGPDVINVGNLNINLAVPVFTKPGRGIPFSYSLSSNSSVWYLVGVSGSQSWQPVFNWGWQSSYSANTGYVSNSTAMRYCYGSNGYPNGQVTTVSNWTYHDSWGITHFFDGQTVYVGGACTDTPVNSFSSRTSDGSGLTINVNTGAHLIVTPGGAGFDPPSNPSGTSGSSTAASDSNGNQITSNSSGVFTDTLGSTALTVSGSTPNPVTFAYTSSAGAASVALNYRAQPYTVQTYYGCSGIQEYGPTSVYLIDNITYPDGSKYIFQYEPTIAGPSVVSGAVTGRVASIKLPTGGTISYTYTTGGLSSPVIGSAVSGYPAPNPIVCGDGSAAGMNRTTPDGTWQYSRNKVGATEWTTTVTDATVAQNQTQVWFQTAGTNPTNFYETKRQIYAGSIGGTPLRTIDTCYTAAPPDCTATPLSLPIRERDVYTTLDGGAQSKVVNKFDPTYTLPTETDEYDFGASTATRKTFISYAANEPPDRIATVQITDGNGSQQALTTYGYDASGSLTGTSNVPQHVPASGPRGNLTSVGQWLNTTGGTLTTNLTYEDTGNVLTSTDPGGNQTQFSYADNFAGLQTPNAHAYVTTATLPNTGVAHTITTTYDFNTGLVTDTKDQNANHTIYAYDCMLRQIKVAYPDGGEIDTGYNSAPNPSNPQCTAATPPWIETKQKQDASTWTDQFQYLDTLGRTSQTKLIDLGGNDLVDTTYDANGRVHSVSNPYRTTSDPTYGLTTYVYDALSRVTSVTEQDSYSVSTTYSGACGTTKDETGRPRKLCSDGLGRLTSAVEPRPSDGSLTAGFYTTTYSYDTLNNLLSISQPGDGSQTARTRNFTYDSLARMKSQNNPESGIINITYDAVGNVMNKTVPAQNQTGTATATVSYCYDALNRMTSKAYTQQTCPMSTPAATYSYDQGTNGIGLRTGMNDGSGQTGWTYDAIGRTTGVQQTVLGSLLPSGNSVSKSTTYNYWLNGTLKSIAYPSGRVINYHSDAAGRTDWVYKTDAPSGQTIRYAQVNSFHPPGQPKEVLMGNVSGCYVGALAEFNYNPRLQPTHILYTTNTDSTSAQQEVQSLSCPGSNNSGDLMHRWYSFADSFQGTTGNNGNVNKISNCIDSNRSQSFSYDGLNRIQTASTDGPNWGEQFTIDSWGNLTNIAPTKGTAETLNAAPSSTKNQLNGPSYDSAGNQLSGTDPFGGNVTYTYDIENRITNMSGNSAAGYTFDGDGNRVVKNLGGNGTLYWRGADGAVLGESDLSGNLTAEYVFFNGQRIARTDNPSSASTASLKYYLSDHLGSTSMITDATFSTVLQDEDYFPYGREVAGGGDNSNHYSFTGDEHDAESNLEHTQFRQLATTQGRWLSPDPYLGSMDLNNPQSFNRYTYVLNNPLSLIDPLGLNCQWSDGTSDDEPGEGGAGSSECLAQGGTWYDSATGIYSTMFDGQLWSWDPNNSVTVNGDGGSVASWQDAAVFVLDYLSGNNANQNYGPNQSYTVNFRASASGQAISQDIAKNCSKMSSRTNGGVSTLKAAKRLPHDLLFSPAGAQVGAFDYTWQIQGKNVFVTVTNTTSINSLLYHIPSVINKAGGLFYLAPIGSGVSGSVPVPEQTSSGRLSNKTQTFQWVEPNSCQ